MIRKALFKIKGMHCVSCAMNIDGEIEEQNGIVNVSTNYTKQETSVSFDDNQITTSNIQNIIKKVGYDCELT